LEEIIGVRKEEREVGGDNRKSEGREVGGNNRRSEGREVGGNRRSEGREGGWRK